MWKFKNVFLLLVTYLSISSITNAQILEPVKWEFVAKSLDNNQIELLANAKIEEGWHVYANQVSDDPDAFGPMPTEYVWEESENYSIVGTPDGGEYITHFDPNFEMDLNYYENSVSFKQVIQLNTENATVVKGELNYMACDDEKCIFPDPIPVAIDVSADRGTISITTGFQPEPAQGNSESGGDSKIYEPAKWTITSGKAGDGLYQVNFICAIDEGWHVYSQHLSSLEGPLPTTFAFDLSEGAQLVDSVTEGTPIIEFDKNFMMDLAYFEEEAIFSQLIKTDNPGKIKASVDFMVCDDSKCLPPELIDFELNLSTGEGKRIVEGSEVDEASLVPALDKINLEEDGLCGEKLVDTRSVWLIFVFGFIGGLIALLTPCVFPMIPLTVSFFTKGGQDKSRGVRDALMYGFFIFAIYALLSVPFHLGAEGNSLNVVATSVALNLIFFAVFVVFAISFFGYFEITLPSGFVNKVDNASSNAGGMIGIFLMALTLALVSFSCTGPILGTVLGSALKEGAWPITSAMSGFGVALGLPFALFAMFPSMMKKLPQSGGWMTSVKVVLGFVELGLALKFLSNADLVKQWHLIERETFFLVWIILALSLAAYLFTLIHFPHDNKQRKVGLWGGIVGAAALGFAIYLAPGLMKEPTWNHNMLSGFPPPSCYSWYECNNYHPEYDDFAEAQAAAIEQNKPILIDFTGWACVNCRKMEEEVWTDPSVLTHLEEDFIVVSLYVDDRVELPAEQQGVLTYEIDGEERTKRIRNKGDKWSTFQTLTFKNNSQPYYVMLSNDGQLLGNPTGYTPDIEEYKEYLQCGLSKNAALSQK